MNQTHAEGSFSIDVDERQDHVTYQEVMSHMNELRHIYIKESCHIRIRHATYEWVILSYMNKTHANRASSIDVDERKDMFRIKLRMYASGENTYTYMYIHIYIYMYV